MAIVQSGSCLLLLPAALSLRPAVPIVPPCNYTGINTALSALQINVYNCRVGLVGWGACPTDHMPQPDNSGGGGGVTLTPTVGFQAVHDGHAGRPQPSWSISLWQGRCRQARRRQSDCPVGDTDGVRRNQQATVYSRDRRPRQRTAALLRLGSWLATNPPPPPGESGVLHPPLHSSAGSHKLGGWGGGGADGRTGVGRCSSRRAAR